MLFLHADSFPCVTSGSKYKDSAIKELKIRGESVLKIQTCFLGIPLKQTDNMNI